MKILFSRKTFIFISALLFAGNFIGCAMMKRPSPPTFNEKMLNDQEAKERAGQNPYAIAVAQGTADPVQASLWAKTDNPYIIRNQKAQKVGDLLTIVINEDASATSTANTDAKRDGTIGLTDSLTAGQATGPQIGNLGATIEHKNELKGNGETDRAGKFTTTVQASVEAVLPNGTLFVRGKKHLLINFEDQDVEVSGFVRPDDIRINNTVVSTMLADAKITYSGQGILSDKQHSGWGMQLLDALWPF